MLNLAVVSLLTVSALLTLSCSIPAPPDTRAADEAAIKALDEQWSATAAKNNVDGTVSYYAKDAVLLAPNTPIATDAKAIRDSWAGLLGPNTAVSWKATKIEVARSGELAYLYGTYDLKIKDPKGGPDITDKGKILEVWKKQPDGQWKCAVDTYNSDIPLPAPPEPKK
jgi:ketosteroid isomerase-like protein